MARHLHLLAERRRTSAKVRTARGFTLIELLVVITIIGMLMAMLLPAVQQVRKTMDKTTCKNNMRNLGQAAINFRTYHSSWPSGGWGYNWVGDPDRGFGKRQPGGWTYSLLPYLEMSDVHDEGLSQPDANKKTLNAKHIMQDQSPLPFLCPSRRPAQLYPITSSSLNPLNSDPVTSAGRTDYAINAGDQSTCQFDGGPTTFTDGDNPFWWNSGLDPKVQKKPKYDTSKFTGVSYIWAEVNNVPDGEAYTYLFGEKFMDPANYLTGADPGDTHAIFTGFSNDTYRTGNLQPIQDKIRDSSVAASSCMFGGPHDLYFHVVMCDGTTRPISFGIALGVHQRLSNRMDNNNPADSDF